MPITPETKNQLRPLPEMPCIFSFRLQCGGEGAPCGRGQGSHCQSAKVGRQVEPCHSVAYGER